MKLAELLKQLRLSGSSRIKDMLLIFKDGSVSAYNASPDRTVASMVENFPTNIKINAVIGISSVSLLEKYLNEFGESFRVEKNRLVFEKDKKRVILPLVENSNVGSAVSKEKFEEWIKIVESNKIEEVVVSLERIKEIVNDGNTIKADNIRVRVGKKISIILKSGAGESIYTKSFYTNIVEHIIEEKDTSREEIEVGFPSALLDVLNSITDTSTLHITPASPLLIKSGKITYLVAPINIY